MMISLVAQAITAESLYSLILTNRPLFILDVRNEDAYADWRIEGAAVQSLNVPYFDMLDGVEPVLPQLPQDGTPIAVVCAKEGSSQFVAEMLAEAGVGPVNYLVGGMKAWSELLHPVKVGDLSSGGEIYQVVRPGKGCLSYLIASGGEAAVIDAARLTDQYLAFAAQRGWTIKHVLDTHLHADHISGGRQLAEQTGATYWLPPKDAEGVTFAYQPLVEGQPLRVGTTELAVAPLYTPGHTIGSTSLIVDERFLLSGDILFVQSIGRPDLAGKAEDWVSDLRGSLYHTMKGLSPDLTLLPAHYAGVAEMDAMGRVKARLGDLYEVNAGLQVDDEHAFRSLVTENLPPQPNAYQEIRKTNSGLLTPSMDEQREMEIGPNRCAVHG